MAEVNRILIFAPDPAALAWTEAELADQPFSLQLARSVREVVRALLRDPPPRAQVLVVDFDAISAADVFGIREIRDGGWFGSLVALGDVREDLCTSLNVEVVLRRPLSPGGLRDAIAEIGLDRSTVVALTERPRFE